MDEDFMWPDCIDSGAILKIDTPTNIISNYKTIYNVRTRNTHH
jgi:hypothetical protein